MCDCIKNIEERLVSDYQEYKGKRIIEAEFTDKSFSLEGGKLGILYYSNFQLELEGRKNKVPIPVSHQFCPFCGEKYNKDETSCS
ncbi:hypothetical protein ACTS9E_15285 [Empedobacter brevis]